MSEGILTISAETARRLAVTKQHLIGEKSRSPRKREILNVVRDLAYVQWDPITIVAPSHIISLWSRIGDFRLADLESLLWDDRKVFLHWTPIASIVLTEDYPIFSSLMRRYPQSLTGSWRSHEVRASKFLKEHEGLRRRMLKELGKGPLRVGEFEEHSPEKGPNGWGPQSKVSRMLFHMLMIGEVMVVGHQGNQNIWGLTEGFLPKWVDRVELTEDEYERAAVLRAVSALGTAAPREINYYFPRGRYRSLSKTLGVLQEESEIARIKVEGLGAKDERFMLKRDIPLIESLSSDAWEPHISLIAPFDNLIAGRQRTNRLFNFDYAHEQFFPKEKRRYGTYVLPILWGDRLIGRVDPQMDKQTRRLLINSVHAEPGAPEDREVATGIAEVIDKFAAFLGAESLAYTSRVPSAWKGQLH